MKQYCKLHTNEELMMGWVCHMCIDEYNDIIREAKELTVTVSH